MRIAPASPRREPRTSQPQGAARPWAATSNAFGGTGVGLAALRFCRRESGIEPQRTQRTQRKTDPVSSAPSSFFVFFVFFVSFVVQFRILRALGGRSQSWLQPC